MSGKKQHKQNHSHSHSHSHLHHNSATISNNHHKTNSITSKSESTPIKPKLKSSLTSDDITSDQFELLEVIGQGTYGEVWKAIHKETGNVVALKMVKILKEDAGFPITALREIRILKLFKHPHIVNLHTVVMSNDNLIYLVFDFAKHDLKGILHHLRQASNILITENGQVKLADFGLARTDPHGTKTMRSHRSRDSSPISPSTDPNFPVLGSSSLTTDLAADAAFTNNVITLWYRPPEILLGSVFYNDRADVWSAGCILAELLNRGKPLFVSNSEAQQLAVIYSTCGTPDDATNLWYDAIPSRQTLALANTHTVNSSGQLVLQNTQSTGTVGSGLKGTNSSKSGRMTENDTIDNPSKIHKTNSGSRRESPEKYPSTSTLTPIQTAILARTTTNPEDKPFPQTAPPNRSLEQAKQQLRYLPKVVEFMPKTHIKRNMTQKLSRDISSTLALDLLEKMLTLDPMKRISVAEALEHDFFHQEPLPADPALIPLPEVSAHEFTVKNVKGHSTRHYSGQRYSTNSAPPSRPGSSKRFS